MCHFVVVTCQNVSYFGRGTLCGCIVNVLVFAAKMCQLSVATCQFHLLVCGCVVNVQDVLSFGRGTLCGCIVNVLVLAAKMCHLLVATCQDVSSFGRGTLCGCIFNVLVLAATLSMTTFNLTELST